MSARAFRSERHTALSLEFPSDSQRRRATLAYRPAPARRVNLFRRVLRRLIGALT